MAEKWYSDDILDEKEQKMPQIIPIKDLKNTSAISEMCHQTDEPIFITKTAVMIWSS